MNIYIFYTLSSQPCIFVQLLINCIAFLFAYLRNDKCMFSLYFTNIIQREAMLFLYSKNAKLVHALHYSSIELKSMFVVQYHVHFINENQHFIAPYALHFLSSNSVVHHDSSTSNSFLIRSMNSYDRFFEEKTYRSPQAGSAKT
jgi:hypothetical protein